ncbi:MAG TPA: hypothetical protein VGD22_02855, partial [Sphingobacteriaceae bacterium]
STSDFTVSAAFDRASFSERTLTDGSFIRLKNLSLSYDLMQVFRNRVPLQSARIFIQAQNLLTFTDYEGLDPETRGFLPPLRTVNAGIQLTL